MIAWFRRRFYWNFFGLYYSAIEEVPVDCIVMGNYAPFDPSLVSVYEREAKAIGQSHPLHIDNHWNLIDGHCRLEALKKAGIRWVLVRVVNRPVPFDLETL